MVHSVNRPYVKGCGNIVCIGTEIKAFNKLKCKRKKAGKARRTKGGGSFGINNQRLSLTPFKAPGVTSDFVADQSGRPTCLLSFCLLIGLHKLGFQFGTPNREREREREIDRSYKVT
jgi:hypothetical protein